MLKYYNYFELESNMDANDKAHEAFEKFEDTNGKNEKKIGWENEDPINSKSEKIALLRKLCDKNLLYYLNLQLKNIFHLMDYNEIELGCVYLNHIKNNLYVMFQLPILLLNVLYEKVVKSFNDYIILDTFFNNSKLFTEFRYEYIFKTKLAYIFCKRFYAMNDIENALKFAQYFDFFRVKVQKKSIYNDYIFHKNLINAYIKTHPSIVPKEWIMLQKENGDANDTGLNSTKEYLEYYTFFFNDISRYIKFNVVEQIINCNIFTLCRDEEALHKEREGIFCQKEREMKKQSLAMGVGVDMGKILDTGMDMQLQMKMQMQKQKEGLTNGGEKQFMSYFRYMVRKSLLDDVVNLYAARGEYFYKRIVSILANKEMKVKVDASVNPYFYLFQQMAFVNHVMQSSLFAQLSIIKKRELYYVHKEDQAAHSLEQLKEECLKHMNMVSYVIQTVIAIVTKLEKNCPKDINIYLIINLRNIIIDIFYLFKYVLTEKEYSIDVLNVLYRNVTLFNDIIYSANPDDTYIFPMEQIRDLFSAVKEKYIRQNVI